MVFLSETRRTALVCVVLSAVTLATFWPVLHYDFINYDDTAYVTENPQVLAGLTSAGVVWAFRGAHFANWHPLTWLSHMLDVQIFGLRAGGHHLISLLFHIANTLLLFLFLKQITKNLWPSAVVAAFFALHPLHVESVAWISERKDVLSTFFALLCLWAYVCYAAESTPQTQYPDLRRPSAAESSSLSTDAGQQHRALHVTFPISPFYLLSLVLFTLGLMSKAMVVTLPCVMLLLDFWPLGRFQDIAQDQKLKAAFRLIAEKIPFLVLGAIGTVLAMMLMKQAGAIGDAPAVWIGERFSRMVVSYQHYIGKVAWPSELILPWLCPVQWPPWTVLSAAATTLGLSLAALWFGRQHPQLPVGWFWFVGTLVPVVGIVRLGAHIFADRYTYFPLIGLLIAIVWSTMEITVGWKHRSTILATLVAVTLLPCVIATSAQIRYWRDSEQLYRHALEIMPDNYVAHNGLGLHLASQRRLDEAIEHYRAALQSNPLYDDAYSNLARALADRGDYQQAATLFETALGLKPDDLKTRNNFGDVLILQGRYREAAQQFQEVLRLQPEHFRAHNNLAICWRKLGKTDQAISEYRAAIRLQPAFVEAINNLAWILAAGTDARFRNGPEAVALATQACELTGYQNPIALTTLAAAYAEMNRFPEALVMAEQAREMTRSRPGPLTARLSVMIDNFRAGQPYHAD
jgi:Tfp pilus assembly protein PilF